MGSKMVFGSSLMYSTRSTQPIIGPKQLRHFSYFSLSLYVSLPLRHCIVVLIWPNRSIYVMRIVNNVTGIEIDEAGMPYGAVGATHLPNNRNYLFLCAFVDKFGSNFYM